MGCFYFFAWPWIHHGFFSRFQCTTCRVTQLGSREASVAKVPSNSKPGCKVQLDSLPVSTGCGILCCSKYGQFPSHFRQEVAKKGLNCAFSGPCFLLSLLFFQRTRAQIPVYFGAWGQGHLDIVELAKCFLELSDFQAGYRRTVTFFVARLNPGHENSWKQFSLFYFSPRAPWSYHMWFWVENLCIAP